MLYISEEMFDVIETWHGSGVELEVLSICEIYSPYLPRSRQSIGIIGTRMVCLNHANLYDLQREISFLFRRVDEFLGVAGVGRKGYIHNPYLG